MFEFLPYASILKIMYWYSCRWIDLNLVLFSRFFQASRVVIFISTYSSVRSGTAGSSTGSICLYRNTVILGFAPVCTLPKKLQWSRSAPALRDVFWSKLWHAWCAGRGILWVELLQNIEKGEKWIFPVQRLESGPQSVWPACCVVSRLKNPNRPYYPDSRLRYWSQSK